MKLQTFTSKLLGMLYSEEQKGEYLRNVSVVVWINDELIDVTGMTFTKYHAGGPVFLEIDTEVKHEGNDKPNGDKWHS